MDADFLFKEETERIIGCAMEVHRTLGHGFDEKPYENALVVEFGKQSIPWQQQPRFDIIYKDEKVGYYQPDLIAFGKVIVETKTIESLGDREIGQMLNYLKITGLKVGLLLNFKQSSLQFKRVVSTTKKRSPKSEFSFNP